jgi:hypothetical protein
MDSPSCSLARERRLVRKPIQRESMPHRRAVRSGAAVSRGAGPCSELFGGADRQRAQWCFLCFGGLIVKWYVVTLEVPPSDDL